MAAPKQEVVQKVRMFEGKVVKSVLYNGKALGYGKYFAAQIDGKLVEDANGRPLEYTSIGELEYPHENRIVAQPRL